MSRKLVLVTGFLATFAVVMVALKARSDDPNGFGDAAPAPKGTAAKADAAKPEAAKPQKPTAKANADSNEKLHGGKEAILKALKEQTSADFDEVPLKEVLEFFSNKHKIPILLDAVCLHEAAIPADTPVTIHLSGVSLRSALEFILDDLKLKSVIHNEVLLITTADRADSDEFMETKIYDVADLVAPEMQHEIVSPLDPLPNEFGAGFPVSIAQPVGPVSGGRLSFTGTASFGSGGGGGFGGGGFFAIPPERNTAQAAAPATGSSPASLPSVGERGNTANTVVAPAPVNAAQGGNIEDLAMMQDLINIITCLVATKTWQDNGGNATIAAYRNMLVITQTQESHRQIEQFLAELRARWKARPNLCVELQWLWLNAEQREHLLADGGKPTNGQRSAEVDPGRLREIAGEVPSISGQVLCENGLEAVLTAGDLRATILTAIPFAGFNGTLQETVVKVPNVGVTAKVLPSLAPGSDTATLEITGLITRWDPSRKPAVIGATLLADKPMTSSENTTATKAAATLCPIDQPVMPTEQIGTTVRVPLGKPVLVGGITFAPTEGAGLDAAGKNSAQACLIVTTSVVP